MKKISLPKIGIRPVIDGRRMAFASRSKSKP
ncbi:L-fucose isomerase [Salmonella enterica subsp. arizonae]|uniref:L-fucose isomerase n=1 Tax=Salmonella enterica subsp. arizonae TaxID=59203 RepID=A0A2X4T290_SALER|nr:L-fucose isomerase [Salmonella enterica subsp. arizonae]